MSSKKGPFTKKQHLPPLNFQGDMLVFRGGSIVQCTYIYISTWYFSHDLWWSDGSGLAPRQGERGFRHYTRQALERFRLGAQKSHLLWDDTYIHQCCSSISVLGDRAFEKHDVIFIYINIVERVESCFKRRDVSFSWLPTRTTVIVVTIMIILGVAKDCKLNAIATWACKTAWLLRVHSMFTSPLQVSAPSQ